MKIFAFLLIMISASAGFALDNRDIEISGDILRAAVPAAAYYATFAKNDPEGRMQFYKSFVLSTGATYGLKETVKKDRPDGSGDDAFPSGHASMSFHGAAFLHKRYGFKLAAPAYAAAVYTSWTRLHADKHSESDILAGAAIGVGSALLFTRKDERVSLVPVIGRDFYGVQFVMKW